MGKNDQMNALSLVENFLQDIREKKASLKKKATDPSEPTTQPVMKADDGTVKATTGSRAAENDSDIRKAYGDAGNSGQDDADSASSTHPSDSIGTQKMDSSETKGNVETPKATLSKPTKPDGGGESPNHPSNATFSEKYSKLLNKGSNFLSKVASAPTTEKKAAEKKEEGKNPVPTQAPAAKEPEGDAKKLAAQKYPDEAEAGYVAAALLAQQLGFSKKADEQVVQKRAEELLKWAHTLADDYCDFLDGIEKKAEPTPEERKNPFAPYKPKNKNQAKEELGKKANGAFPGGDPSSAGMIPPEAMASDLAGGGGGGMPGGMGGGAPGGDPMGGGMPGGMPGGGGGGGGDESAIIDALAAALDQAGVTPEQLAQAVAAEQGGGGGDAGGGGLGIGGPGPTGGDPTTPESGAEEGASSDKEEEGGDGGKEPREEKKEEKSDSKEAAAKNKQVTKLAEAIRKKVAANSK